METALVFNNKDYKDFFEWLNLNRESLTWQGKYEKDFQSFIEIFFIEGLTLKQMINRFDYAISKAKVGPLQAWFKWVQDRLLCFCFVKLDLSVWEISKETGIDFREVALLFRNFLVDIFPHFMSLLDKKFELGNITGGNLHLKYSDLMRDYSLDDDFMGSTSEDVMTSLEVTLYPEWKKLISKMQKNFINENLDFNEIKDKASFRKQLKFLEEVIILFLVAVILIFVVKLGNSRYEEYLAEKIKIYEPEFIWLDKTKTFKEKSVEKTNEEVELITSEINKIQSIIDQQDDTLIEKEERFVDESDVVLTSVDDLPKQFEAADFEQSSYEEEKKGYGYNFRDYRFGRNRVYRIMIRSENPFQTRKKIDKLLGNYDASQADNVKPGKQVPGGIYYNLYVPRKKIAEFIKKASEDGNATLFETKTKGWLPPGKGKVFIWIKQI